MLTLLQTCRKMIGGGEPPSRTGRATSQRDLLALEYISEREPPPGFEQWVKFARQNQCHLGPYTRIDKDLQVNAHPFAHCLGTPESSEGHLRACASNGTGLVEGQ